MIVTFLLLAGIVPGSTNCLHVIDEIHEMRSPRSVSGFMLSFTIRLPGGNFLQELKSFSPGSSAAPGAPGVPAGVVGVTGVAPVGLPKIAGAPPAPAAARFKRRSWRAVGGAGVVDDDGGVGVGGVAAPAAGGGVGPAPDTTAARATTGAVKHTTRKQAIQPARAPARQCLWGVIECCIPC